MNLGKLILSIVFSMLIFFSPVTAGAFNFADYAPLTLGNYWTYQNHADPTDTFTGSVFEEFMFAGNPALKMGTDPNNYAIGYNDGTSLNIYALVENGILNDFDDVSIGEITDGMFINLVEPTNFALFRLWDNLDPVLKSVYGIDPSLTNLILWAAYDSNFPANSQNSIVESNLGVSLPNYAVTHLDWHQQGVGMIVIIDVDAATGTIKDRYDLIDYKINRPLIEVEPPQVNFGAVKGGRSRTKSVRLRNVGDADLRVEAMDVTPMPPFELVGPQPPFTVAPGEEVEVTLSFTPTQQGKVQGESVIRSNDPDEPEVEVRLKGKGKR